MDVYGYALFWSATACVVAAVVVCTLVVRYGFTRDPDLAGRWGWRPTRVGHGLAAALFGTGIALAILALTAVPIGGKEGNPGLGPSPSPRRPRSSRCRRRRARHHGSRGRTYRPRRRPPSSARRRRTARRTSASRAIATLIRRGHRSATPTPKPATTPVSARRV